MRKTFAWILPCLLGLSPLFVSLCYAASDDKVSVPSCSFEEQVSSEPLDVGDTGEDQKGFLAPAFCPEALVPNVRVALGSTSSEHHFYPIRAPPHT